MKLFKLFLAFMVMLMRPWYVWGMNKGELVDAIAKDAGLSKAHVKVALDSLVDVIASNLRDGISVSLGGFGSFSVSRDFARSGRNPQTGATIKIKAKKVSKFKAGVNLSKMKSPVVVVIENPPIFQDVPLPSGGITGTVSSTDTNDQLGTTDFENGPVVLGNAPIGTFQYAPLDSPYDDVELTDAIMANPMGLPLARTATVGGTINGEDTVDGTIDGEVTEDVVYAGQVTDEFLNAMQVAQVSNIDQIAKALEDYGSSRGRIVAFDVPGSGIDASVQLALERDAALPPSTVTRFLASFRTVINDVLATNTPCAFCEAPVEPCLGTPEECDQVVRIRGLGEFSAIWDAPESGVDACREDPGLCQLLVQFEAHVDFGLNIIEGLQSQVLDRLYEEATNVKAIVNGALSDIDCYCIPDKTCDTTDDGCFLVSCNGIDNNCDSTPLGRCEEREISCFLDTNGNGIADVPDSNCDGVPDVTGNVSAQNNVTTVCKIKTQRKGAADGKSLLWAADSCVQLAEDWGERGRIMDLCGEMAALVNTPEVLYDFVGFFQALGDLGDGNSAAGERVRQSMKDLRSLSRAILREVEDMRDSVV